MTREEGYFASDEYKEKMAILREYQRQMPDIQSAPVAEQPGSSDPDITRMMLEDGEKAIVEQAYTQWNQGKDYPLMKTKQNNQIVPPTKEEAKEQGMIGGFIDGVSDAALGLYSGIGYGVDELAVSATSFLNMMTGTPEYEARLISKYMETIEQRGVPGELARSLGQFMVGWLPWTRGIGWATAGMKGVKGLKKAGAALEGSKISSNFLASSLAGGTAFSPNHENIGNMLGQLDNHLAGAVSEMWATDPNDPEWKNRLRNALQEGGLNWVGDIALVPAAKALGRGIGQFTAPFSEKLIAGLEVARQTTALKTQKNFGIVAKGKKFMSHNKKTGMTDLSDGETARQALLDNAALRLSIPKGRTAMDIIEEMDKTGALDEKFRAATTLEEKGFLADNIAEQLHGETQRDIGTVAKVGGKPSKTWAQVRAESTVIFEETGLSPDLIRDLPKDFAWNDSQIYSFARLVKSTGDEMKPALEKFAAVREGNPLYKELESNALRTVANHADSLAYLEGSLSTAARALRIGKAVKRDLFNNTISANMLESPELAHVLRTGKLAGHDVSRMTQMILKAYQDNGAAAGARTLIDGIADNEGGFWNIFIEGWIQQGLLSNPATHALNMFTGGANIVGHIGSQVSAAFISKLPFMEQQVLFREAFGSVYGLTQGLWKSFKLALRAGLTNEQMVTKGTKIEGYGFKHLTAKNMGKGIGGAEDTALGLGFDFMGFLNRLPGRFLLTGDEFVKSLSYEMNLHSKAWKYAWKNGAKESGQRSWVASRQMYKDIIDNPKLFEDQMGGFHEQGLELANLMTFQKEVGASVNRLSGIMQQHPYLKLFVPFIKVLTNIPKYAWQHSPVGFIGNQSFKQGGAARTLEMGRMAYGTMMMLTGAILYNNGLMTGTGARQYHKRKLGEETGTNRQQSLLIKPFWAKTDQRYWMDISRFAPVSNLMTMGADIVDISNAHPDDPAMVSDMTWKAMASVQKNLVSGTWAPNLHKLLGALADDRMEPRDWDRVVKSIVGTLQPSFVRSYEKYKNPDLPQLKTYHTTPGDVAEGMPEDWSGLVAKLLSVSSSHSDLVPNRRNVLGNIVKHAQGTDTGLPGFATNPMVSFLSFTKADERPVLKHLFNDLELELSPPSDILDIGAGKFSVRLTPEEYDDYTKAIPRVKNDDGNTLVEQWDRLYKSKYYKGLPDVLDGVKNDRKEAMRGIYTGHKRLAKNYIIRKYDLIRRASAVNQHFKKHVQVQPLVRSAE